MFQLSVIIPVYNAGNFIERCFSSIDKHRLVDVEIVFVNDGSADDSLKRLELFAEVRSNVKVLHKENGGAASARNMGIRYSSGLYIAFVDADDTVDFPALLELLQFSKDNNLDICTYGYNYISGNGTVVENQLKHPVKYNTIDTGLSFLQQGYQPSSICVFLVKRNLIVEHSLYFHEGITHEDVEVSLKYFLAAERVYFSEQVIYNYYQNQGSVTNQMTVAKKEQYLLDEVTIAGLMRQNLKTYTSEQEAEVIKKNYNSVIWNLLFQLWREKSQLNYDFKMKTIGLLRKEGLYPIKGPLKTPFQHWSRLLFNVTPVIKFLLKP